jgi:hypothetical protein
MKLTMHVKGKQEFATIEMQLQEQKWCQLTFGARTIFF